MGKLLLTGVDGNLGAEAAKILMELENKENLIFCGYNPDALKPYAYRPESRISITKKALQKHLQELRDLLSSLCLL